MNTLIRKEVRLLLPNFLMGLALILLLWLVAQFQSDPSNIPEILGVLPFIVCPVFLVLLTVSPWGREISHGTFAQLLAQPLSRKRIWRMKAMSLAIAVT